MFIVPFCAAFRSSEISVSNYLIQMPISPFNTIASTHLTSISITLDIMTDRVIEYYTNNGLIIISIWLSNNFLAATWINKNRINFISKHIAKLLNQVQPMHFDMFIATGSHSAKFRRRFFQFIGGEPVVLRQYRSKICTTTRGTNPFRAVRIFSLSCLIWTLLSAGKVCIGNAASRQNHKQFSRKRPFGGQLTPEWAIGQGNNFRPFGAVKGCSGSQLAWILHGHFCLCLNMAMSLFLSTSNARLIFTFCYSRFLIYNFECRQALANTDTHTNLFAAKFLTIMPGCIEAIRLKFYCSK